MSPTTTASAAHQRARDLLDLVRLDDVADLDVVEVLDPDAALEALAHLADVVLEALERGERAVVHLHAVANHPDLRRPRDPTRPHEAAADAARLGALDD